MIYRAGACVGKWPGCREDHDEILCNPGPIFASTAAGKDVAVGYRGRTRRSPYPADFAGCELEVINPWL
jgi:hypothetical protein